MSKNDKTTSSATPNLAAELEAEALKLAQEKAEAEAAAAADADKARQEAQITLEQEEIAKREDADNAAAKAKEEAQLELEKAEIAKRSTKATAAVTEEARVAAAQAEVLADADRRASAGKKRYRACFGFMIDPDTQKEFDVSTETKTELTSWLQFQIDNGKIEEVIED